jgi:cell division protein FtsL
MKSEKTKDTVYIDVDEEITGIIDKIKESDHKVVALVLPKRASVFQSIVNLKLLKRSAEKEGKNIVLITSESSVLPIAGAVGLHVAKTLQSKPEIPSHPDSGIDYDSDDNMNVEDPSESEDEDLKQKPVGQLAAAAGMDTSEKMHKSGEIDDTIDIGDELQDDATGKGLSEAKSKGKNKNKKDKNLKVPNFTKFRKILITGLIVLVALVVLFLIFGNMFNKATIDIQTQTQPVNANLTLNLSTSTKSLNTTTFDVPAVAQSTTKNNSSSVPTTGQVNNGNKATGSVSITCSGLSCCTLNGNGSYPVIPSGTGLSSNGISFVTQSSVQMSNSNSHGCSSTTGSATVIAVTGGTNGNLPANSSFTITGSAYINYSASSNSAFTGGTDNMVNAVSQNDVNAATQKINAANSNSIKQELKSQLSQAGLVPIDSTFTSGTPTTSASPSVGSIGNNVTVTETTTYTMLGVQQSYLNTLVNNNINNQINTVQQSIIDNGVKNAQYTTLQSSPTSAQVSMQDTAYVGANLNKQNIKSQIKGKKSGDVESFIKAYPGVNNVTVKFSPFWVSSVPNNDNKIIINITKS